MGWGRERNIELGPCQAASCFVWAAPEAFWGQGPRVSEMLGGTGQRAWAQETSRPREVDLSELKFSQH